VGAPDEQDDLPWSPPDFAGQKQARIGASVVEQFVSGHNAGDVLRELVQNEFDGGGDQLNVKFGENSLEIVGNGRGITADGWQRLSVIVGTGRVVGAAESERVDAKANGIGSKNFGLRSLFLFGDNIYVRSGGLVAVLDLRTLETGKVRDPGYWGGKGVRIQVPFRRQSFEILEPFGPDREAAAFDVMAGGVLATLVKLALPGNRAGLRGLTLHSARSQRTLDWKQTAQSLKSPMKGISVVRRVGRLSDTSPRETQRQDFEELEFSRSLELPAEYGGLNHPNYFQAPGGRTKIGISLPVKRKKLDLNRLGHFYYPLQAPEAATGCIISVSAPFLLNNDRSGLTDHGWNAWLIDQAAAFTVDLLSGDWFARFGVSSFRALVRMGTGSPAGYIDKVLKLISERECWPTRFPDKLAKANQILVPEASELEGFVSDDRYLDPTLAADEVVRDLAVGSGAARFSLAALVRLRCAGDDAKHLQTKLKQEEGNWHFAAYETALRDLDRQIKMAASLSALAKRLSPANRSDLHYTRSTISAADELKPAKELVLVPPEIWDVCHEPMENRLHPALASYRAISSACRTFDEQNWIVEACDRATDGSISALEQGALYARLLDPTAEVGRRALSSVKKAPVVKSQRSEWVAPEKMVCLKGSLAKLMAPVLHTPSKELLRSSLAAKLKIRDSLGSEDLVAFARGISARPDSAEAFERLLGDNLRLLTPSVRATLSTIPFVCSKAGSLEAPKDLHLNTPLNRAIVDRDHAIVMGTNHELYHRLGIVEHPSIDSLLTVLDGLRDRSQKPTRPDLIYPAIAEGLRRERRSRHELRERPIVWWNSEFHSPSSILVGPNIPRVMDQHIPVMRKLDQATIAYLALGAREQADDGDWQKFFNSTCGEWDQQPVVPEVARSLTEAYFVLGHAGLPPGLDNLECLLARNGRLYTLDELRSGTLIENDFPALADALDASEVGIGIVDISEKNRSFFHRLRIRSLSSLAGAGTPIFGGKARQPIWFRQSHDAGVVEMLRRPIFAQALHAIALRRRQMFDDYSTVSFNELEMRLRRVAGVAFYDSIVREYRVGSVVARVPVEAAINGAVVGLVSPRTRLDFQQLFAQALAEIAGATNVDLIRTLSTDMLPLVLARSAAEIIGWLERLGVFLRDLRLPDGTATEIPEQIDDDACEEAIRQVMSSLSTEPEHDDATVSPIVGVPQITAPVQAPQPIKARPLPPLEEVRLSVEEASENRIERQQAQHYGSYGYGGWSPRTGAQVDRDYEVGQRGEALVYRMEIERVRKQGHPNPEQAVIWTSLTDLGSDHDICSVDAAGNPRWIEVKSTTGTDGRFDWSRKEFEKAMRERERYELWRVYQAASSEPVAKCFPNPSKLLGASHLQLELATLRAIVEGLG
jgi:hypothetical protein